MIVRCKSCNSAFAVDDEKVSGKKFAYSCLKCGTENIVDNRIDDTLHEPDMSIFSGTDTDSTTATPAENTAGDSAAPDAADDDLIFDDSPSSPAGRDEPKLTRQEDIDELFASIPDSNVDGGEETPLDLNEIDLEFEDSPPTGTEDELIIFDEDEITVDEPEEKTVSGDDIDIDLAEIDIDFDESIDLEGAADTSEGIAIELDDAAPEAGDSEAASDEDITLDLKELDIDLDEPEIFAGDKSIRRGVMDESEEDLKLNLDELDIDIEEEIIAESDSILLSDSPSDADEDLTLNLDELDIDIEEHIAADSSSVFISDSIPEVDEDLTLNLNELDIDLEDDVIKSSLEKIDSASSFEGIEEDESITIDLDTLDLDMSEHEEDEDNYKLDDEDKLTIDDAGLTFDELAGELHVSDNKGAIKKSIKDSLDEIDPEFELHAISDGSTAHERHIIETIDGLPEIDLDEYEEFLSEKQAHSSVHQSAGQRKPADDINFDDIEIIPLDDDLDIYTHDDDVSETYISGRGTTALTIDFSLKYSRIGALLRLSGLYLLTLIPQFIVLLVYSLVSSILGFINQVVILFTGRCVEDFSQISENTLRYLIYFKTNITGIVEDRPVYSGKANLNHQLQINITYPVKYSRNIALLRLSVIGIIIFILPHLLILALLSLAAPAAFIAGLIIVAATGRWPGVLFAFLARYFRYQTKVAAFAIGLNDEYPPFRFE